MQSTFAVVMAASLIGMSTAEQPKEDNAKINVAKTRLATLDKAVQAYYLKNDKFPETIKNLVDDKFVETKSILDLWDKEFKYDVAGKKNGAKKPDIWTVTPDKMTIGNWPEEKK